MNNMRVFRPDRPPDELRRTVRFVIILVIIVGAVVYFHDKV